MLELYLLHPIAVHFPIALLTFGFVLGWVSYFQKKSSWLQEATSWSLWVGTLFAWAAMGLGLLAEDMVPHVPPAWETLAEHETLGFWTVGLFTALSLWRLWMTGALPRWISSWAPSAGRISGRAVLAFLVAWGVAEGVLLSTAFHGGELVFHFGVGVQR